MEDPEKIVSSGRRMADTDVAMLDASKRRDGKESIEQHCSVGDVSQDKNGSAKSVYMSEKALRLTKQYPGDVKSLSSDDGEVEEDSSDEDVDSEDEDEDDVVFAPAPAPAPAPIPQAHSVKWSTPQIQNSCRDTVVADEEDSHESCDDDVEELSAPAPAPQRQAMTSVVSDLNKEESSDDDDDDDDEQEDTDDSDEDEENLTVRQKPMPIQLTPPMATLQPNELVPPAIAADSPQPKNPLVYDADQDPDLEQKNIVLVILLHGVKCQATGRCPFPSCAQSKTMIRHVSRCTEGPTCKISFCANSKFVLRHGPQIQAAILNKAKRAKAAANGGKVAPAAQQTQKDLRQQQQQQPSKFKLRMGRIRTRRAAPRRQYSGTMSRWVPGKLSAIPEENNEDCVDDECNAADTKLGALKRLVMGADDDDDDDDESDTESEDEASTAKPVGCVAKGIMTDAYDTDDSSDGNDDGDFRQGRTSQDPQPLINQENKSNLTSGCSDDEDSDEESEEENQKTATRLTTARQTSKSCTGTVATALGARASQSPRETRNRWEIEYSDDEDSEGSNTDPGSAKKDDTLDSGLELQEKSANSPPGDQSRTSNSKMNRCGSASSPMGSPRTSRKQWETDYSDDEDSDDNKDAGSTKKENTADSSDKDCPRALEEKIAPGDRSRSTAPMANHGRWDVEYSDDEESEEADNEATTTPSTHLRLKVDSEEADEANSDEEERHESGGAVVQSLTTGVADNTNPETWDEDHASRDSQLERKIEDSNIVRPVSDGDEKDKKIELLENHTSQPTSNVGTEFPADTGERHNSEKGESFALKVTPDNISRSGRDGELNDGFSSAELLVVCGIQRSEDSKITEPTDSVQDQVIGTVVNGGESPRKKDSVPSSAPVVAPEVEAYDTSNKNLQSSQAQTFRTQCRIDSATLDSKIDQKNDEITRLAPVAPPLSHSGNDVDSDAESSCGEGYITAESFVSSDDDSSYSDDDEGNTGESETAELSRSVVSEENRLLCCHSGSYSFGESLTGGSLGEEGSMPVVEALIDYREKSTTRGLEGHGADQSDSLEESYVVLDQSKANARTPWSDDDALEKSCDNNVGRKQHEDVAFQKIDPFISIIGRQGKDGTNVHHGINVCGDQIEDGAASNAPAHDATTGMSSVHDERTFRALGNFRIGLVSAPEKECVIIENPITSHEDSMYVEMQEAGEEGGLGGSTLTPHTLPSRQTLEEDYQGTNGCMDQQSTDHALLSLATVQNASGAIFSDTTVGSSDGVVNCALEVLEPCVSLETEVISHCKGEPLSESSSGRELVDGHDLRGTPFSDKGNALGESKDRAAYEQIALADPAIQQEDDGGISNAVAKARKSPSAEEMAPEIILDFPSGMKSREGDSTQQLHFSRNSLFESHTTSDTIIQEPNAAPEASMNYSSIDLTTAATTLCPSIKSRPPSDDFDAADIGDGGNSMDGDAGETWIKRKVVLAANPVKSETGTTHGPTVYQQVEFQKKIGSLTLSSKELQFSPQDEGDALLCISWGAIVKKLFSPPPLAVLKMSLLTGEWISFRLDTRVCLERLRSDVRNRTLWYRESVDEVTGGGESPGRLVSGTSVVRTGNFTPFLSPTAGPTPLPLSSVAPSHALLPVRSTEKTSPSPDTPQAMFKSFPDAETTTPSPSLTSPSPLLPILQASTAPDLTRSTTASGIIPMPSNGDVRSMNVFPNIKFRGKTGSLFLDENHARFTRSDELGIPILVKAYEYATISKIRTSPMGHTKAMLQLVLVQGTAATFETENRKVLGRLQRAMSKRVGRGNALRSSFFSESLSAISSTDVFEATSSRDSIASGNSSVIWSTELLQPTSSPSPSDGTSDDKALQGSVSSGNLKVISSMKLVEATSSPLPSEATRSDRLPAPIMKVFLNVLFKKTVGTVTLSQDKMSFLDNTDKDNPNKHSIKSVLWQDVATHQTSPPKHAKAMLRLVLHTGKTVLFEFANRDDLTSIQKEITLLLRRIRDNVDRAAGEGQPATMAQNRGQRNRNSPRRTKSTESMPAVVKYPRKTQSFGA